MTLFICKMSFTQVEDTTVYDDNFGEDIYYWVNSNWIYNQIDSESLKDYDYENSKKIHFNPFIDIEVMDSINKLRISKGYREIPVNYTYDNIEKKQLDEVLIKANELKENIFLVKHDNALPNCDCYRSITNIILDDSLIYVKNKSKEIVFKTLIFKRNIKSIIIIYYQFENGDITEENLKVLIKRRFGIFTIEYPILKNELKK